ncbi:MAG: phenylacetate-CoA oxygenase subunit PaaC [Saprospiraceae bacterium]|nr:phenylacetate-CoA oxygenase subunit PaaC [Saprospiraceae bacterium]
MQHSRLKFILQWADNSMILGQRLSEWCGHGPVLEHDIALTNIALDLIGEARYLYQYAAVLEANGKSEDDYPFLRKEQEFFNVLLVEQPNEDWAVTMVRQFMFDCHHLHFLNGMSGSDDPHLSEIALKTAKEARYHLKYSSDWVIRLGDGTAESKTRMQDALDKLAKFQNELFIPGEAEVEMIKVGICPDMGSIREKAFATFDEVIKEAGLTFAKPAVGRSGGKNGIHSEHMGYLLATMQYMQRTYPGLDW